MFQAVAMVTWPVAIEVPTEQAFFSISIPTSEGHPSLELHFEHFAVINLLHLPFPNQ